MRPLSSSNTRYNNFDFLRFVLASLVVFTHCYNILSPNMAGEPFLRLTHNQLAGGTIAVDFFFVISGFLIANSWMHSRNLSDYLKKRVLRIYPGFIVVVLLTVVIAGPLGATDLGAYFHSHRTYGFIWRQLLFHKDPCLYGTFHLSRTPDLPLGSLATIRFEVGCYLMLALLGAAGFLRRPWVVLSLFIASLASYNFYLARDLHLSIHYFGGLDYLPRLVTYFLAGTVFYVFRERIPNSRLLLAFSVFALALCYRTGLSIVFPLCGTYLLFWLAFSPALKMQNFGRFGDFSYGVFLYGYPVQQVLVEHYAASLNPTTLFLLALPITFLLAIGSWYGVEKPFLKLKSTGTNTVPRVVLAAPPQNQPEIQRERRVVEQVKS